jgi:hypothetical protein
MLFFKVFGLNLLLTILECGLFGPAASKLDSFGLRGWAGRAPFYLLPLYIGPAIVFSRWCRESRLRSGLLGLLLTLPSAFWVIAARCPWSEAAAHPAIGLAQGLVLAWLAGVAMEGQKQVLRRLA